MNDDKSSFRYERKNSRHEFSKIIFWLVWGTNLIVILFCGLIMLLNFFRNGYADLGLLNILIPSTAAELASATGFYYWKTRTNNVYEYGEQFIIDLINTGALDPQHVVTISQAFFNSSSLASATMKQSK